jgi:hypothetical protein
MRFLITIFLISNVHLIKADMFEEIANDLEKSGKELSDAMEEVGNSNEKLKKFCGSEGGTINNKENTSKGVTIKTVMITCKNGKQYKSESKTQPNDPKAILGEDTNTKIKEVFIKGKKAIECTNIFSGTEYKTTREIMDNRDAAITLCRLDLMLKMADVNSSRIPKSNHHSSTTLELSNKSSGR